MENRPFEITEKDLIDRPASLGTGAGVKPGAGTTPQSIMKSVQEGMKQFKEIKEMAESLGLKFNLPGVKGEKESPAESSGPTMAQQVQAFLQLLQYRYGDITVNEALKRLKDDLGDKRLSEMRGVKLT